MQLSPQQQAWHQTIAQFHDLAALVGGPSFVPAPLTHHIYGTKEQQETACSARDKCLAALAEDQKHCFDDARNIELMSQVNLCS